MRLATLSVVLVLLVAAPANAEVIEPAGKPKGVMIVIHGGAWLLTGDGAVASARPAARRYAKLGWRVHSIDHEPGLESYCVIADAAPTDLVNYNGGTDEVPVKRIIDTYLKPYFDLVAWSPAYSGARMRQPAVLNYAENDPIVPVTQADALRATANTTTTELNCLPAGTADFVHSGVDATHLGRARAEERKLLRELARR